ncbi:MAG: hypothetical protein AAF744_12330 [Pseudomonadota bacterium]
MTRKLLLALAAAGLVSACTGSIGGAPPQPGLHPTYSDSIGFTSINGEPFPLEP